MLIYLYCMRVVSRSVVTLCDPLDCSLPGASVHGILQARILKWVAVLSSRGSFQPRDGTCVSCIGRQILYHWATLEVIISDNAELDITSTASPISSVPFSSVAQSCPTLCDPMNCSTPGLPVYHQLPEFTQIHIHRVDDAIQPSYLLSSCSPHAPNP